MTQLPALILTLCIESPIICLGLKTPKKPVGKLLALSVVPSLLTHPWLWLASAHIPPHFPYFWSIFVLELMVAIIESYILVFLSRQEASLCLAISAAANAASTLLGIYLWRYF